MENYLKNKNNDLWNYIEIKNLLFEFLEIYNQRPIINNHGGMEFPSLFALYFYLKKIKPDFVIESGVYKGQSTWLIEKTLPNADILSIDIHLNNRIYISKKVTYSNLDFKFQDFSNIASNTLAFFDDHQHAIDRLMQCKWFGIKKIIFDDNYIPGQGNCYSLKKAILGAGSKKNLDYKTIFLLTYEVLKQLLKKKNSKNYSIVNKFNHQVFNDTLPNINDKDYLIKNLETYFEFPPLFQTLKNHEFYKKPLLEMSEKENFYDAYKDNETYVCPTYVKLY